ncbi:MAG: DHH family phosphoesterase [Thermodesulfobacteriota bacterium]
MMGERAGLLSPDADQEMAEIAGLLRSHKRFLLMTHVDPDADGIGSMLALGRSLSDAGKAVVMLTPKPLDDPLNRLKDAARIVNIHSEKHFDVVVALDCAEKSRLGTLADHMEGFGCTVNIDHHDTNDGFGTLNLNDPAASSTGELVFQILKKGSFFICADAAANLFAAIQADTGAFRFSNTTPGAMRMAAELIELGARPWEISKDMDGYDAARLKLLELALATMEFHFQGRLGMMTLNRHMFTETGAEAIDCERFVDYPRFVHGVEIAAVLREVGNDRYKCSLRSNTWVNVARLASGFGGGGHKRAAGFECHGSADQIKRDFLTGAGRFLNDIPG